MARDLLKENISKMSLSSSYHISIEAVGEIPHCSVEFLNAVFNKTLCS